MGCVCPGCFTDESNDNLAQNVNTVDVIMPSWPAFIYTNPKLGRYLLEGLFRYQATGQYPNKWSVHDLGADLFYFLRCRFLSEHFVHRSFLSASTRTQRWYVIVFGGSSNFSLYHGSHSGNDEPMPVEGLRLLRSFCTIVLMDGNREREYAHHDPQLYASFGRQLPDHQLCMSSLHSGLARRFSPHGTLHL